MRITTIEGVAPDAALSAVQQAFIEHGGAQCGICTPGMVIAAASLLERHPNPTEAEIRTGLAGNLCRCTGYMRIFEAVVRAADRDEVVPPRSLLAGGAFISARSAGTAEDADHLRARLRAARTSWCCSKPGSCPKAGTSGCGSFGASRHRGSGDAIAIGALTTYTEIARHPLLQTQWPLLCRAAEETGGVATQNRGTIGGNIANASPAADTPPALIVYARSSRSCRTAGPGECLRSVPYRLQADGSGADELIARIHLPQRAANRHRYYRKVGTRRAQAISKVCIAVACDISGDRVIDDIRIALGSVAPTVVRARAAEAALRGHGLTEATIAAAEVALEREIAPIDDIRSNARYRMRVARALLREALRL